MALTDGKKKASIQQPRFDYYNMDLGEDDEDVDLTEDELSHIVEIYDFPAGFKTEDLLKTFQCYQCVALGLTKEFDLLNSLLNFSIYLFFIYLFLKKKWI